MLLPVGAAFGPRLATGTVEFRDDPRANAKSADAPRRRGRRATGQSAACRNCARRHGRDGNRARRDPRASATALKSPRSAAKILARATVGRTARELLVAAKFSLRPITTGTIAIARRPGAKGPIATRTVAVFAKTFATRRIGPLLAATFARGIGLLVAKFPVGKTSSRARIVAITARRTVVAIEIRTVAARLERALLAATIIARTKILTRSTVWTITGGPHADRPDDRRCRDRIPANGRSPRGRGASPKSRRGGRSSPSRLPA